MTREESISVLERVAHTESKWPGTEDTLEALDMAISALRQQDVSDTNVGKWISVKDRLPDATFCVLVHYDDGNVLVDAVGSDGEWMDEDFSCGNITHWMPLPEPPEDDHV